MIKERDRLQDAADAADRRVAALQESIDAVTVTEVYNGIALYITIDDRSRWCGYHADIRTAGRRWYRRSARIDDGDMGGQPIELNLLDAKGNIVGGVIGGSRDVLLEHAKRWVTRGKK